MTRGAQTNKPAQLRKARIETAEQELDDQLLELREVFYSPTPPLRFFVEVERVLQAHAALVKARGGK